MAKKQKPSKLDRDRPTTMPLLDVRDLTVEFAGSRVLGKAQAVVRL